MITISTTSRGDSNKYPSQLDEYTSTTNFDAVRLGNHSFNQDQNSQSIRSSAISVSQGSSIYVSVQVGCTQSVAGIIDSQHNTFFRVGSAINHSIGTEVWYLDNVDYCHNYTVIVTLSNTTNANIQVTELQCTANPSLDTVGTSKGHGLVPSAPSYALKNNNLALLSVVTSNSGNTTFTTDSSEFVTNAISSPAPGGQNVAGATIMKQLNQSGHFMLTSNITGHDEGLDWAAVMVSIKCAT